MIYLSTVLSQKQHELPTLENWKSAAMHDRPLIRQYRNNRPIEDTAANVTAFVSKLRENLEEMGADTSIDFHFFRSQLESQAGELGADYLDICAGFGHTTGAHNKSYRATVGTMQLFYAGYKHLDDPEHQGAWVQALYKVREGLGRRLYEKLCNEFCPGLLQLEEDAAAILESGVDRSSGVGKAADRTSTWTGMVSAAHPYKGWYPWLPPLFGSC